MISGRGTGEPLASRAGATADAVRPASTRPRTRVSVVDVLRGLVMVIMALDHTREFFTDYAGNPLDPQQTSFALYMTRWVTHLCAPVFVFLAGTSIFLQQQTKNTRELTALLLTSGVWLIVAELTLVHLAFNFNWQWNVQILEVIWAIGASMSIMALLVHLGVRANLLFGAALIFGHNAFDRVMPQNVAPLGWLWALLHVPGLITGPPTAPPIVILAYPLLPWIGVMAMGYVFGSVLLKEREKRILFEVRAGVAMLGVFALLRWSNLYGDPFPWTKQAELWRTLASFMNVQKYPPSLLFLMATLGLASLMMAWIEFTEEHGLINR
ncbi:MAG TPA: heparan-alpha-glucosaminide N-acetyltransferase domain-containing protein, partial [Bryobacteraceae bacterium]|nr:heparan-alpha-glucosaminide N-acetyltransferase domain-containing protein [Bryobacteraceae bacterium]